MRKINGNRRNASFGILLTIWLTTVVLQVEGGNTCYRCAYVGPPLDDLNAYPCMKNYVPDPKEENPSIWKENCNNGESLCFYELTIQNNDETGKVVAMIGTGCLSEESRKCKEDVGAGLSLDTKGTCSTITSPTGEQLHNIHACRLRPDGSGALKKAFADESHYAKQNETQKLCVCSGSDCNGTGGVISLSA